MLRWFGDIWNQAGFGKPAEPRPRSGRWPRVEQNAFIRDGFRCRACGRHQSKVKIVGHHARPYHLFPDEELDLNNVLTMCQPMGGGCHLRLGHLGADGSCRWVNWNPNVVADAAKELKSK